LDLDTQGAMHIKSISRGVVFIFITPPSLDALAARLRDRGSETEESFARRMSKAEHEMSFRDQYDYVVVNDDVARAVREFHRIIEDETKRGVQFECPV
jgi:guanylate kinase